MAPLLTMVLFLIATSIKATACQIRLGIYSSQPLLWVDIMLISSQILN